MPKTRRRRPAGPPVLLPKLSPHWHPPGCSCELSRPYIRVSKVGTRDQVISPELQLRAQEQWARANNRRLLEPVCDINKSGRTFRKRSVMNVINEIEAGKYRHVILWKWSRWARNPEESAKYLKMIRDAGGWVDSATEDADQNTAIGKLQIGIIREFDAYTSNVMQETWKGVHERRREAGLPHGGRERFGYDYIMIRDENGTVIEKKYVVIEDEAEMLKTAYSRYVEGASFNRLVAFFKGTGTTTTLGGQWTAQGIARMMDTGFAAGLIRERSNPTDKPSNSITGYDVWRSGAHDPIIDADTWAKYMKRRLTQASLPPRLRKAAHGLSALMFCNECRRRLVTKYAGAGRTHQWQCAYQKSFHVGVAVTVNNRLTLQHVREWVRAQYSDELPVEAYKRKLEEEAESRRASEEAEHNAVEKKISILEGKIDNLVELAAASPERAKNHYNAKIESWAREVEELRLQLKPQPAAPAIKKDYDALRKLDEVWDELTPEVLREALANLISRIEVSARTEGSTRTSVADRVLVVGVWEEPSLEDWLASRSR